jgi:hypothetical protein
VCPWPPVLDDVCRGEVDLSVGVLGVGGHELRTPPVTVDDRAGVAVAVGIADVWGSRYETGQRGR